MKKKCYFFSAKIDNIDYQDGAVLSVGGEFINHLSMLFKNWNIPAICVHCENGDKFTAFRSEYLDSSNRQKLHALS